jgi:hypothetical protein
LVVFDICLQGIEAIGSACQDICEVFFQPLKYIFTQVYNYVSWMAVLRYFGVYNGNRHIQRDSLADSLAFS